MILPHVVRQQNERSTFNILRAMFTVGVDTSLGLALIGLLTFNWGALSNFLLLL